MRGPERDGGRASRRLLSGPTRCVTRLLKAVEVEPDNAHPKTTVLRAEACLVDPNPTALEG